MRRGWAVPIATGGAVLAVLGIVAALLLRSGPDGAGPARPVPPVHDPPAAFAVEGAGTALPREVDGDPPPVALDGFDAFVALRGRLQVIDTRSGAVRAEHAPRAATETAAGPRAPVPATLDGRAVTVAAFVVTVPGRGTTVAHDAVELLVVDNETLQRAGGARIDLAPNLSEQARLRGAWPVAVAGGIAVVVTEQGPDRGPVTHVVELSSGREVWRQPGLAAAVVAGGLVIGVQRSTGGSQVVAVRLADGRTAWTAGTEDGTVTVWPAGRSTVAGGSVSLGTGARVLTLHDAGTGRVLARRAVPGAVTCRFDGRLTTVCWHEGASRAWAAAFDVSTGRTLWELPDVPAGRVAPRISTVWHGTVYGTTENGPVALDARTGSDLPRSPGIAPDVVNEYVGIVGATVDRPRARAYLAVA